MAKNKTIKNIRTQKTSVKIKITAEHWEIKYIVWSQPCKNKYTLINIQRHYIKIITSAFSWYEKSFLLSWLVRSFLLSFLKFSDLTKINTNRFIKLMDRGNQKQNKLSMTSNQVLFRPFSVRQNIQISRHV